VLELPFPFYPLKFCYIDTEYLRHDLINKSMVTDRFAADNVTLYSIQYSIFKLDKIKKGRNPILKVLKCSRDKSELELLKLFFPVWKNFFGQVKKRNRLIPFGFVVLADLQLLANKYAQYKANFLEEEPDLSLKYFNPLHVIQISRALDLAIPAQLYAYQMDVKLQTITNNERLNGENTRKIILQLMKEDIESSQVKELVISFNQYVHEEYHAALSLLRLFLRKLYSQEMRNKIKS